ncbi:MAG: hypothetical protein KDA89_08385 [Planctomycetaceae bacterium]|nr:hypothetical protein [Planctomycetaceae bacterium]
MEAAEQPMDDFAELRRFRKRCLLFSVPLGAVILPALLILAASGECFTDMDDIIRRSEREEFLIGFAYNEGNYGYLKYRRLLSLPKQSVVALGSSRVLGFREDMFTGPFYNAGFTIVSPWDFRSFLQQIPDDKLPDVLIAGLDQFMFNAENNESRPPKPVTAWTTFHPDDLQTALKLLPDVYKNLARGRIDVGRVLTAALGDTSTGHAKPIGLNGLLNSQGFRNDGSMVYGGQVKLLLDGDSSARDFGFSDTLNRIRRGRNRFNWCGEPDSAALEEIDRFLQECAERKVFVTAFLPPYADAVWNEMQQSGNFEYLTEIETRLRGIFEHHGFELYSFHRMADCDASDQEAIDGFHAGENVYARMLIRMADPGSALSRYVSIPQLNADLENVVDRYTLYPESGRQSSRLAAAPDEFRPTR